jgi:glutathione S-transferase
VPLRQGGAPACGARDRLRRGALPFLKRDRPEVEELTGQRWVPVLVYGDEVVNDSHRILGYLNWLETQEEVA